MKKQIRISEKHFKELDNISKDLGMKKSEVLGLALGLLRSIKGNNVKSLKMLTNEGKEIDVVLSVDLTNE